MRPARKPWWHQATALVSLSAGGAVTGFSFAPGTPAHLASPDSMPIRLMALEHAAQPSPGPGGSASDSALRSAIVNVARYYLRMAGTRTPAEVSALIWRSDSTDGAGHGPTCAAFASLTLELAAQVVGQSSWVTGGSSYPWPLHTWADVRVEPNPDSPGITSIQQDAEEHGRWHPLGDGYQPLPGDWVLFDGHVEVVTGYSGGVLHTIGANSPPDNSVNAHAFRGPLGSRGVIGFVNNGELTAPASEGPHHETPAPRKAGGASAGTRAGTSPRPHTTSRRPPASPSPRADTTSPGPHATASPRPPASPSRRPQPATSPRPPASASPEPGGSTPVTGPGSARSGTPRAGQAAIPGAAAADAPEPVPASPEPQAPGTAAIPGVPPGTQDHGTARPSVAPYRRHVPPPSTAPIQDITDQQAFVQEVAPGAIAAQRNYGIPAAVTIAQAIDESGWGHSELAARDHNLFGIKGVGPAGSDPLPTQEYENGQWVTITTLFRVYHNVAESIDDHSRLIADSGYYTHAMAERNDPNAFAEALTGVYATSPDYGGTLISLMQQYNLYRYGAVPQAGHTAAKPGGHSAAKPGGHRAAGPGGHAARRGTSPAKGGQSRVPPGGAAVPGIPYPAAAGQAQAARAVRARPAAPVHGTAAQHVVAGSQRYRPHLPLAVEQAFITRAKVPLLRSEPLYRDVASNTGVPWQLLAACDWMQCQAQPRYSPVHGEKLGTANPDGTVYWTKSEALQQCAEDLAELAGTVYRVDLLAPALLSLHELAEAFAAFRWGGLLRRHRTSAMEFPYSVAGLTAQHLNMRWPSINEPNAPDKPGGRFRRPFGAVPVVLSLDYPVTT